MKIALIFFLGLFIITQSCVIETNKKQEKDVLISDTLIHQKDTLLNQTLTKQVVECEKCKIEYVKNVKLNINNITNEQISLFLCTLDDKCKNNVEFSEFSSNVLFLLLSKYPHKFIEILSLNDNISTHIIKNIIEKPINDLIDLKSIKKEILLLDGYQKEKNFIIESLDIAISKYN